MVKELYGNKKRTKFAIWGAGRFGRFIYEQLKNREDIIISFFLDRNPDIVGKKIGEIEIFPLEYLQTDGANMADCVLVSFPRGIKIYSEFPKWRNIRFGVVKDRVFQDRLELKDDLMEDSNIFWVTDCDRPLMQTMETNIVDYCNLNCKGCTHFSNLYHKGDMVPFDTYCKDLKQLSQHVNILRFNLLGGEVLLLKETIINYINTTREILPYSDIGLITNGLLLPKQKEDFFLCCLENNIVIEVSEYMPTTCIKEQITEILDHYGIMYKIRENIGKFMKNIDLSGKMNKYEAMQECLQGGCNFLRKGKLYKCPFEALGNKFFEHFQLDIRLQGGIDIYDKGLDWKELIYNYEKEPVDACRYCAKGEWFPWESSGSPAVNDWIVGA